MVHVLLIEDDADIREGVRILLEGENCIVDESDNGDAGVKLLRDDTDLVILDIMMPGISGLRACEMIRKKSNVPVLFLTAKSTDNDKMLGLIAGADDYLTKPFSYSELLGRVKALVRRYRIYQGKDSVDYQEKVQSDYIEYADFRINRYFNEVTVGEKQLDLSEIEYRILLMFLERPSKTFSSQEIYETIWEEPYRYSYNSNVSVHIRKLRVKVEEDPKHPTRILTVWGKGYRFGA